VNDVSRGSVLVTGANGFVGSRLCRRLISDGYRVTAGIREGCDGTLIENLDLEYRFGDVTQPETLPGMVEGIDYVVHNAGVVKVKKPETFFDVNKIGTRNILEAVEAASHLKKFVYISSMAAAGPSEPGEPLTEETPPHPATIYGQSKLAAENEVLAVVDSVNSVIIRPPAIYGPGDREMFTFFKSLNDRIKPYLGNPARRIQLVHVDDLAFGVSRALQAETKSGSIYFIAEDESYSYYMLVKYLRRAVGRMALPIYIPGFLVRLMAHLSEGLMKVWGKTPMFTAEKANEILDNWEVSVEKARRELDFEARIHFPEGAQETVYWYREEGWL
jgi:nucleoside-diphosphate-sugar epimerase